MTAGKSVFVATPAYGGQVSVAYMWSALATTMYSYHKRIEFSWMFRSNSALINMARNDCVAAFLESGFTHLLFIDADIGWTDTDLDNILGCDEPVVAGTYPKKQYPIVLVFNPLAEDDKFFTDTSLGIKVDEFEQWRTARADVNGLVEVRYAPTGFMLIQRSVFDELRPYADPFVYPDGRKMIEHRNYFTVGVKDTVLLSEDWAFCEICRTHGIPIYLNTNIITTHTGNHCFSVTPTDNNL